MMLNLYLYIKYYRSYKGFQLTILGARIETLVIDCELSIRPKIIIYTSINSQFKITCQAEALFSI